MSFRPYDRPVRAAFIGLGRIYDLNVRAYVDNPDVEVVALVDQLPERRDERGFYFFVDRVGETYRWKGENVSTAEVLTALTSAPGVLDGVVYGVEVPGADGRAGTAALVVDSRFDLTEFRADVARRLPAYARPVFVRLLRKLETTGTFNPRPIASAISRTGTPSSPTA